MHPSSVGGGSLLGGLVGVGEGVHVAHGGEDIVEVHEDVVGGEADELTPTPECLPEEGESVVGVAEAHVVADDVVVVAVVVVAVVVLLEREHARRAGREAEVAVAGVEEELGNLPGSAPPRDRPDAQLILDDDPSRELPLGHGGRAAERGAVELHGGGLGHGCGGGLLIGRV